MSLKECQTALDNFRATITEMEKSVQTIVGTRDDLVQTIAALQMLKEVRDLDKYPRPDTSDLTPSQRLAFMYQLNKEAQRVLAFTKLLKQMVGTNKSLH